MGIKPMPGLVVTVEPAIVRGARNCMSRSAPGNPRTPDQFPGAEKPGCNARSKVIVRRLAAAAKVARIGIGGSGDGEKVYSSELAQPPVSACDA